MGITPRALIQIFNHQKEYAFHRQEAERRQGMADRAQRDLLHTLRLCFNQEFSFLLQEHRNSWGSYQGHTRCFIMGDCEHPSRDSNRDIAVPGDVYQRMIDAETRRPVLFSAIIVGCGIDEQIRSGYVDVIMTDLPYLIRLFIQDLADIRLAAKIEPLETPASTP